MDGKKMNELVSSEVLKWRTVGFGVEPIYQHQTDKGAWEPVNLTGEGFLRVDEFDPCNDWNDMKTLIDGLETKNMEVSISNPAKNVWEVIVFKRETSELYRQRQEKAGVALCETALKAIGVDTP